LILRHAFEPRDNVRLAHLCGSLDAHLRNIESLLDVSVSRRNEYFRVEGPQAPATQAMHLLQALYEQSQRPISAEQLQLALVQVGADPAAATTRRRSRNASARPPAANAPVVGGTDAAPAAVALHTRRADLVGRTPNQAHYLRNILDHDITFGIGPAGTGKTFLAVACAVDALERSTVQRIILTRPAVEAGERLGFLPGDLAQKVDPYLRPLYDALYDLMGADKVARALERGLLEVAPLAFMRGRTLNHAFVILDEAQNSTAEQMKMFLTRIGFGTKVVVNGDVSQVDLPRGVESGLIDAERVLRRLRGIAITRFSSSDVVRHPLVARIVEAYDAARPAA
jgi:phosphate starvation-inducible PhoH-like protein